MQIRTSIHAGTTPVPLDPSGAAPQFYTAPAALDAMFHSSLAELKLWVERMLRKYGLSGLQAVEADRFWELDAARGLALVEMTLVHFINTWLVVLSPSLFLSVFAAWQAQKAMLEGVIAWLFLGGALLAAPTLDLPHDAPLFARCPALRYLLPLAVLLALPAAVAWLATAGSGATGFLAISGIALSIGHARKAACPGGDRFDGYLRRGASLFAWGLALSLLSLLLVPQAPVLFGILHMLGVSTVLVYPFLNLPAWANLGSAAAAIGLGELLEKSLHEPAWLWLGGSPNGLRFFDYEPLLPWFGALLIGVVIGKLLYRDGQRAFKLPNWKLPEQPLSRFLAWLGQYSLPVYLVQMPLALAGAALAA